MRVYNYTDEGYYLGSEEAFPSPAEPGKFLIPRNATEVEPPLYGSEQRAKWNGTSWEIEDIPLPEPEPEPEPVTWEQIRAQRDGLLIQSDWVLAPDVNIVNKIDWFNYRQQLRDIPETFANPEDVVWPEKPEIINSNIENENNLFKAELFINNFYSPTRLLQMKTWWDEIPHQLTPKLSATYVWIENVTKFVITSQEFDQTQLQNFQPPFTFVDVSQEIRNVLYPATITEELSTTETPEVSSTITEELSTTETPEVSS